jgi:hypothetical protein
MRQRIALFRIALLVAVWFAASANGAPVLAQPGGTGGTVGKTNKSLSGGEDAASPAQSSTERSHANGRETKSKSERKHVTRHSEPSRSTRNPAAAEQAPLAPGGHGGGPQNARCEFLQRASAQFSGVYCY